MLSLKEPIRSALNSMNLGDVNVKEFGQSGDYLIKVEQKTENDNQLIPQIKKKVSQKTHTIFIILISK